MRRHGSRRSGNNGVDLIAFYNILIRFMPKPAAIAVIALFILSPIAYYYWQTHYSLSDTPWGTFNYYYNLTTQAEQIKDKLNNSAKNVQSKVPQGYKYSSEGLAKYYKVAIPNSKIEGNILKTNFAELEFVGDGSCIKEQACLVYVIPPRYQKIMARDMVYIYLQRTNNTTLLNATSVHMDMNKGRSIEKYIN